MSFLSLFLNVMHPCFSEYPDLHRIKRELNLLSKLYSLYNSVIDSVSGYYDILWADLNIEKINSELLDFQNRFYDFTFLTNLMNKYWTLNEVNLSAYFVIIFKDP